MPSAWNMFVKKIYEEGKAKDSNYEFKQALVDASKRKSEMGSASGVSKSKKSRKSSSKRRSASRSRSRSASASRNASASLAASASMAGGRRSRRRRHRH